MKFASRLCWVCLLFVLLTADGCCQPTAPPSIKTASIQTTTNPANATKPLTPAQRQAIIALVEFTEERLTLMFDVARIKWNRKLPIENLERERELLYRLVQQGTAAGLSEEIVARFFQNQFDAAKDVQQQYFTRWIQEGMTTFADVPDLDADIRPIIDRLSQQMIEGMLILQPVWNKPDISREFYKVLHERETFSATDDLSKIDLTPSILMALGLHNAPESLEH